MWESLHVPSCSPCGCPLVSPHRITELRPSGCVSTHFSCLGTDPGGRPLISPHRITEGTPLLLDACPLISPVWVLTLVGVPSCPLTPLVSVPSNPLTPSVCVLSFPLTPSVNIPWVSVPSRPPSCSTQVSPHSVRGCPGWVLWHRNSPQSRVILAGHPQSRCGIAKAPAPSLKTVEIG